MELNSRLRLQLRIQNGLRVVLLLIICALLAWLSNRYSHPFDWTANARHTLSETSRQLLEQLPGPVQITAYAREDEMLRRRIADLVGRYQRHKADLQLEFVNPDTVPDQMRKLGITLSGELRIEYQGRSEQLQEHTEQALSNALQRVARAGERWAAYLVGHGERELEGEANHDLGAWGRYLGQRGYRLRALSLAEAGGVPRNTSVLIIASPTVRLLPGEVKLVVTYLQAGGNLLWLHEPGKMQGLQPVADLLGLSFEPGVVVDANTRVYGIREVDFALVSAYPTHALTRNFNLLTLFPKAVALRINPTENWTDTGVLVTGDRSWAETGEIAGEVRFDEGQDVRGPLTIGAVLERALPASEGSEARQQRVMVVGDGDFLSNTYLGNGGNLDLGMAIIHWLSSDDGLISIPARIATDLRLDLSPRMAAVIGLGTLFGMPLLLLASGFVIWFRRRRR